MTELKATKGPWSKPKLTLDASAYYVGYGSNFDIAICAIDDAPTPEQAKANAHLIAAAPQLYDLLEEAIPATFEYDEESNGYYDTDLTHRVRSALAAARGEE